MESKATKEYFFNGIRVVPYYQSKESKEMGLKPLINKGEVILVEMPKIEWGVNDDKIREVFDLAVLHTGRYPFIDSGRPDRITT